jgi:hypothetical protein
VTTGLPRQFRCFVFWSLFSPAPLDTNNIHTTSSGNFFNGTVAAEAPTPIGTHRPLAKPQGGRLWTLVLYTIRIQKHTENNNSVTDDTPDW